MSGCWQAVLGDASCAAPGWSRCRGFMIWLLSRGSSCLRDFPGRYGCISSIYTRAMLVGACLGAWYYAEDFKQPHESCLHPGQNLPKFLVSKVRGKHSVTCIVGICYCVGVAGEVWEHFMIIVKLKLVHQSVVLFLFSIQGPKL